MLRRLSAILAADVVGYSALMEEDEAGTFDRLRARRTELIEPEIAGHHGRVLKLHGRRPPRGVRERGRHCRVCCISAAGNGGAQRFCTGGGAHRFASASTSAT